MFGIQSGAKSAIWNDVECDPHSKKVEARSLALSTDYEYELLLVGGTNKICNFCFLNSNMSLSLGAIDWICSRTCAKTINHLLCPSEHIDKL